MRKTEEKFALRSVGQNSGARLELIKGSPRRLTSLCPKLKGVFALSTLNFKSILTEAKRCLLKMQKIETDSKYGVLNVS